VLGERTRDFAFVSLCYRRCGEEICTGYAMAASGRMQYDYKQTNLVVTKTYSVNGEFHSRSQLKPLNLQAISFH